MVEKTGKQRSTSSDAHRRSRELQKNAQIAYQEVATQEEMLNSGHPVKQGKPSAKADPKLTRQIDDALYEAAQQGNIGGG